MRGIYLAAFRAYHSNYDIIYQDINGMRDLGGNMLDIDLDSYDYIIATPPCNFWSRARGNRISQYALLTKDLLPLIIKKLSNCNKPFIIENVCNIKRFKQYGIIDLVNQFNLFVYVIGRHIYFSNIYFIDSNIIQRQDFKNHGYVIKYDDMNDLSHQGGFNVHNVVEVFLQTVHSRFNDNFERQTVIYDFL